MRLPSRTGVTQHVRMWLAHRLMWLVYLPVVASAVHVVWPTGAAFVELGWMIGCMVVLVGGQHGVPFCRSCLRQLAAQRPDTPRQAARRPRHRTWLYIAHVVYFGRYGPWPGLIAYAVAALVLGHFAPVEWHDGLAGVAYTTILWGPLGVALYAAKHHMLFEGFCPFCPGGGWNDGDSDQSQPDPDPVPSGQKTLTPA